LNGCGTAAGSDLAEMPTELLEDRTDLRVVARSSVYTDAFKSQLDQSTASGTPS
jgi:hypothetical protein